MNSPASRDTPEADDPRRIGLGEGGPTIADDRTAIEHRPDGSAPLGRADEEITREPELGDAALVAALARIDDFGTI